MTAHYMTYNAHGELELRSELIAFRHMPGSHTGAEIAKVMVGILKDVGIAHKVICFASRQTDIMKLSIQISAVTLDNASNNGTAMVGLAEALAKHGIRFDPHANRIRQVKFACAGLPDF